MTTLNNLNIPAGTWNLDISHSEVGFIVRHAGISKVRGKFGLAEATVVVDDELDAKLSATIDATSFDSGNADRDGHVRSGDFLDVENHPTITFVSNTVEPRGNGFIVTGDLTIRGVSKTVDLYTEVSGVATDPFSNVRAGVEAKTTISRKEFGLTWNAALEAGGVLVSDKVVIELDLSFIHAA